MRILVFCDEDLGVAAGGARQVLEFAQALSQRSHTIRIVAPQPAQGRQLALEFATLSFRPVSVWRVAGLRPFSFLIASWHVLRKELAQVVNLYGHRGRQLCNGLCWTLSA